MFSATFIGQRDSTVIVIYIESKTVWGSEQIHLYALSLLLSLCIYLCSVIVSRIEMTGKNASYSNKTIA